MSAYAPFVLSLLVAALSACSEEVGTSVRVRLVYVDTWPMITNTLIVDGQSREIELEHELLLLVSDDRDGQVMNIQVTSTRGTEPIANGSAVALIRKGETVDAAIVMNREPCGQFCKPQDKRCEGENATVTCVRDPEGCLQWEELTDCPADLHICSSGECDRNCRNECEAGERSCQDTTHEVTCANTDSDPCLDLSAPAMCNTGDLCYSGRCRKACTYATSLTTGAIMGSGTAFGPTLAVDPKTEMIHALYSASGSRQLMYANRPKGLEWSAWTPAGSAIGENPVAAVDSKGVLHVVYGGTQLVYGTRAANGTWAWEPAFVTTGVTKSFSIAVDDKDVPHVVYYQVPPAARALRHAYGAGTTRQIETIPAPVSIGHGCDITFADGTLHVSSFSDTNGGTADNNVWYSAKPAGQAWTSVEAAKARALTLLPEAASSIVVDRAGTVTIVFSDLHSSIEDFLGVAYRPAAQEWSEAVIDDSVDTGAEPDAVIDPFDNIHVVYRSRGSAPSMRYASGRTTTWNRAPTMALTGLDASIAVEPEAHVYIVSRDLNAAALTSRPCN